MDEKHETEKALLIKLERVLGRVPIGTTDFLHVLTHPDVIDLTEEYVRAKRLLDDNRKFYGGGG